MTSWQKGWKKFKSDRLGFMSLIVFIALFFFSLSAEIWSSSAPIIMKHNGSLYFPVYRYYHPSEFNQAGSVTNYRELQVNGWQIWPINRWDPYESNPQPESFPSEPTSENWFGTDDRGRDIFSRILYGFRYSIVYALIVWACSFSLGMALGGAMGYFGGKVDLLGQRVVEIYSTIPQFFILIIVVSVVQPNLIWLAILSTAFSWIFISYYTRAEFLKLKGREFVEAAKALGATNGRIIFRHILPNALGPAMTFTPFFIAAQVAGLASLDYLGFGLQPPTPSWGELLHQGQKYFTTAWWVALFPSLALFSTLVLLGAIGESLRKSMSR